MWQDFETWRKNNVDHPDCEANSQCSAGLCTTGVDMGAEGGDYTALKCSQCGEMKRIGRGDRIPSIGWCGCDNNARTGA